MDNIVFFKEKNKYGFDISYVKIERNYLESLKKYIGSKRKDIQKILRENTDDYIVIPAYYFQDLVESMIFQADLRTDKDFFNSVDTEFIEAYNSFLLVYTAIRGTLKNEDVTDDLSRKSLAKQLIYSAVFEGDLKPLKKCIEASKSLLDTTYKIFKQRDLRNAKTHILDSLKYIVSPTELEKYQQEYDALLTERPINLEKIENYLKSLQQIILEDWKKNVTSLKDYKPGDMLRIICHSTNSEEFNGDFYSALVSCSLLTEEFTDTYRSGFGFILGPDTIVGADSDDMYVNNYTDDDEEMLNSTSVPKIASIGKVLEQCRQHREENKKNGEHSKIYSEVIIKGFKPIGIFCLTVGEKSLNANYCSAKKLQSQYPDLPVIEIDLTYYKDKDSLTWYRNALLFEIERNIDPNANKKDSNYYDLYEYFWEQYLKLKQNGDYKESDIIDLYRENSELISMGIWPERLLSGKYSIEAIKYAIMNNPSYKLKQILSGEITAYDLKALGYELINYGDNKLLNEAVPGLGKLLKIIDMVEIERINVELILQTNPITIESICDVLQIELDRKVEAVIDEISELEARKQALTNSYASKERELKTNQEHKRIIDFSCLYSLANCDYQHTEDSLLREEKAKKKIAQTYTEHSSLYGSYQTEQIRLSKHKIFNFFKLRKLKAEMEMLKAKIDNLGTKLERQGSVVQALQTELSDMRESFRKQTGIELKDYASALAHSREQYSVYLEIVGPADLEKIQSQIYEIDQRLGNLLKQKQHIEQVSVHKK